MVNPSQLLSHEIDVLQTDQRHRRPADPVYLGDWWHADGDRIVCDLCPRECVLKEGDRGFCFVRQNVGQQMVLTTYGRSTGFCIDPIEKKPLNHFYPGTSVLSFGTAGCNLGCKFCQNWDISKSREIERLSELALPDAIARAAKSLGCASVAFTYNDPVIWAEYAIDTARACRDLGIKTVAVTAGYVTEQARGPFFEYLDAANVDLKGFTEEFYYKITLSHLKPVLDTLRWLKAETDVWFEITNLIIPDANDDSHQLQSMCDWILESIGDEVPVHFTAFHPDFRMRDRPNTPVETLIAAREIALETGLKYVYTGNVDDVTRQSTYCPDCQNVVIERNWYELGRYDLMGNACARCGSTIQGHFDQQPGNWGRKRQPVNMRRFREEQTSTSSSQLRASGTRPSEVATPAVDRKGNTAMVMATSQPIDLTNNQQELVSTSAAQHVTSASRKQQSGQSPIDADDLGEAIVSGVFVSLKRQGRLRSCCGSLGQSVPLKQALREAAVRTATNDPRFPPISPTELAHLDLEVWLLYAPEQVVEEGSARVQSFTIGRHGLQVVRGENRGLLLPGVAVENKWDSEEFLNNVCIKAGLPPTAWKDENTTLLRFEGECVRGRIVADEPTGELHSPPELFTEQQVAAYVAYTHDTIATLLKGATPNYYCSAASDANVNGAVVDAAKTGTDINFSAWKLSLKQAMPLQSTLFALCQQLAQTLRQRGIRPEHIQTDIGIVYDPAMHGTLADPDLAGIATQSRGILVQERGNTALAFDGTASAEQLLRQAGDLANVVDQPAAQVFSVAVLSSAKQLSLASVRKPSRGSGVRPPAVAGTFYPADAGEATRMLDQFLASDAPRAKYAAAMVPHAGWRYSGQIAADVLKRIEFPETVIVIGPKHTAQGVDWAVAPHFSWSLPTGTINADLELAKELADRISGLQLDAAAHQQEHGVEVELPFIHHLSPDTRVVGIAIGTGNLQRCESFAIELANVLKSRRELPLLLISSDMNHFANDRENRRLDEMALIELDRCDVDALYKTVTKNHISMCGVLPAVIVLKTLQHLGRLNRSQRVGYATSADVTGDVSRVVGYAGMLFR